jgi:hypothetical protein
MNVQNKPQQEDVDPKRSSREIYDNMVHFRLACEKCDVVHAKQLVDAHGITIEDLRMHPMLPWACTSGNLELV